MASSIVQPNLCPICKKHLSKYTVDLGFTESIVHEEYGECEECDYGYGYDHGYTYLTFGSICLYYNYKHSKEELELLSKLKDKLVLLGKNNN